MSTLKIVSVVDGEEIAAPTQFKPDVKTLLSTLSEADFILKKRELAHEYNLSIPDIAALYKICKPQDQKKKLARFLDIPEHKGEISLVLLLEHMQAAILQYMSMSKEQALLTSLWVISTYAIEYSNLAPLLLITAPTKGSGKTKLADIVSKFSYNGYSLSGTSASALFRRVDRAESKITLCLDEADTIFSGKASESTEGIRQVLNAGYSRHAPFIDRVNMEAEDELESFNVYCPKVLSMIGSPPSTILDRSIKIHLEKKPSTVRLDRLSEHSIPKVFANLRSHAKAWADAYGHEVYKCPIEQDEFLELSDRAFDNSYHLLQIAKAAGPEWYAETSKAIHALYSAEDASTDSKLNLLKAIKAVFEELGGDKIHTVDLLAHLKQSEEDNFKHLTGRILAGYLSGFKIKVVQTKIGGKNKNGYHLADFKKAWDTHLQSDSKLYQVDSLPNTLPNSSTTGAVKSERVEEVDLVEEKKGGSSIHTQSQNLAESPTPPTPPAELDDTPPPPYIDGKLTDGEYRDDLY